MQFLLMNYYYEIIHYTLKIQKKFCYIYLNFIHLLI